MTLYNKAAILFLALDEAKDRDIFIIYKNFKRTEAAGILSFWATAQTSHFISHALNFCFFSYVIQIVGELYHFS